MPKPKVDAEAFFRRLAEANPDPRGELEYINPYTLLVAVVLSAQATDVSVNKATEPLFEVADTPQKMLALGEARLKDYIRTIGLYNTKAKNIIRLSEILLRDHGGQVPRDREALQTLPGVGRKTANVVLNVAFGQPTMAVDTHIFRVGNRSGLAPGKTPDAVEQMLMKRVPEKYRLNAHHWLILHGRYVCKARKPDCAGLRRAGSLRLQGEDGLAGGRVLRRQHVAEAGIGLRRLGRRRARLGIDDAWPARLVVEHHVQHAAGGAVLPYLGRLVPADQPGSPRSLRTAPLSSPRIEAEWTGSGGGGAAWQPERKAIIAMAGPTMASGGDCIRLVRPCGAAPYR